MLSIEVDAPWPSKGGRFITDGSSRFRSGPREALEYAFAVLQPHWRKPFSTSTNAARTLVRRKRISLSSNAAPHASQLSFAEQVESELCKTFRRQKIERVLDSFQAVREGRTLETGVGTPQHRHAHSFIQGLDSQPFHDVHDYGWVQLLEKNWSTIAQELNTVQSNPQLMRKGTNVWVPAARHEATAYGPDWRTLVIQDREWDPVNSELFSKTTSLLRETIDDVPSVEVFFAKQAPGTGISLHTDDCNFILTMHLGLDVPEKQSWIEVGGERRYWENGKSLVFDTSYFHRTSNESSDKARTVLLIRFWHPQLTMVERDALSFIFRAIENPSILVGQSDAVDLPTNNDDRSTSSALSDVHASQGLPRSKRRAQRALKQGDSQKESRKARGFGSNKTA